MSYETNTADVISLQQMAANLNNDNLNGEILVFDSTATTSKEDIFPVRIDALMIILVTSGSGKIGIDLSEYELRPNTLIVIQPKNYIFLSDFSSDFKYSAVACSRHVVEDVLPKLTDLLPLLLHHRAEPVTMLNDKEADGILNFYKFLREKLQGPQTPFLKQKVLCMLQAALYEMMEINTRSASDEQSARTRKQELMAKFIIAVSENFRIERLVAYYARKLCITPKHLSSVVKEISGRTAGDRIENYVIMESKVLLKTTDMTIQEIAVYLNFANQSFFGKYFKHHTGVSPTEYRKKYS